MNRSWHETLQEEKPPAVRDGDLAVKEGHIFKDERQ